MLVDCAVKQSTYSDGKGMACSKEMGFNVLRKHIKVRHPLARKLPMPPAD